MFLIKSEKSEHFYVTQEHLKTEYIIIILALFWAKNKDCFKGWTI